VQRTTRKLSMPSVRVGTDLASVTDVADAVGRFGDAYLERLFTEHEITASGGRESPRCESLAARFAAKEATTKALRLSGAIDWRAIEVHRSIDGSCEVRLSGFALASAMALGLQSMDVSLSHDGGIACATVVALVSGNDDVESDL